MKRLTRLCAILLVAVMLLSALPMTASAKEIHSHPVCGKTHADIGDHTGTCADIEWTAVHNEAELINALQTGGNYYLAESFTISTSSNKVASGVTVNLCLNGKTVTRDTYGITVYNATFNICDCVGTGNLTGTGNTEAIYLYINTTATLNFYGGSISGNQIGNGGAVSAAAGTTFNMYGGSINNNYASHGSVNVVAGKFHMYGGEISGNTGNNYGAVNVSNGGNMIMENGAVIEGNKSQYGCGGIRMGMDTAVTINGGYIARNESGNHGGGIHMDGGTLTINGGTITENVADFNGGGISSIANKGLNYDGGIIIINGGVVTGNTDTDGNEDNVYLGTGKTITVGNLANNTKIGVTMSNGTGTFTSGGAAYKSNFESDDPNYGVAPDGNNLKLARKVTVSFDANGGEGSKDSVEVVSGENYTLPDNPFTAPEGHKFKAWRVDGQEYAAGDAVVITANTTVKAVYERLVGTLTVKNTVISEFAADNDVEFTFTVKLFDDTINGTYGDMVFTDGVATVKLKNDETADAEGIPAGTEYLVNVAAPDGFVMTGRVEYEGIVSEYGITSVFTHVRITYAVQFVDHDGTLLEEQIVPHGGAATAPTAPDRAGYKFTGWDVAFNNVTENLTVTAQYTEKEAVSVTETAQTYTYDSTNKAFAIKGTTLTGFTVTYQQNGTAATPNNAGTYDVIIERAEDGDYNAFSKKLEGALVINKADQTAPAVTKTDETISQKADGKITGVDTTMEYRKEGETDYTAIAGDTIENLTPGKYYVRVKGDSNHNASPDTVLTIAAGRKLTVQVPQNTVGYTVTTTAGEVDYGGTFTATLTIHEGYSKKDNFKFLSNGADVTDTLANGTTFTLNGLIDDVTITVEGVADITAPAAQIKVDDNKWTTFWNNLTFGLYFNEKQDVTIMAVDSGSGVHSVEYYLAGGELELDEVRAITAWEGYNGTFKIDPDNRYVVYAKVTDNAGNTVFVNSDGLVLDATAPTLEGIENGKTYYGDLIVIISNDQFYDIKTVTLDGEPMSFAEGTYGLVRADNGEHTVIAEDYAGNKTTYIVKVMKEYTVTFKVGDAVLSTETVGHGKDATLPNIPAKEGYDKTAPAWDSDGKNIIADTTINAVHTINKYTVTYKADGKVVKTLEVEHGKDATAPAVPAKEGYSGAWEKDAKNIIADTTINAVYTINKYTVTYKADGKVVKTLEVEHGKDATAPAVPAKEGYSGTWEKEGKNITANTTIVAVYTKQETPTEPTNPPETTAPTEPPETTAPTEPPETTAPTEPPETTAPTEPPETTAPTEPPETTVPTEPSETTVPTTEPKADNPNVPGTGDNSPLALSAVVMAVSLSTLLVLLGRKRKHTA